jgi:hypothetical protein
MAHSSSVTRRSAGVRMAEDPPMRAGSYQSRPSDCDGRPWLQAALAAPDDGVALPRETGPCYRRDWLLM